MGGGQSKAKLEEKLEHLKTTPFFTFFEQESALRECAKHFTMQTLAEGEYLKSSCFLIVVSGELALSTLVPNSGKGNGGNPNKNTKQHVSELLAVKKAGDFFSKAGKELAAEGSQKPRRSNKAKGSAEKVVTTFDFTTVRALRETTILKLDANGKRAYLDKHSAEASLMEKILNTDIKQMLKPIPFLKGLSHTRLSSLAELFTYEAYTEGQVVLNEGGPESDSDKYDDSFYLVLQGELDVTAAIKKQRQMASFNSVSALVDDDSKPGSPLLDPIPSDGELTDDEEEGGADDGAEQKVDGGGGGVKIASIEDLRKESESLTNVPVLRPQPSVRLLRKSSTVNEEKNLVNLARLEAGSYFGEMGMMVKIPRTATVCARSRCLVAKMKGSEFQNFLKLCPEIRKSIEHDVRERMVCKLYAFRLPFFAGISKDKLLELSNLCTLEQYEKGKVLMEEGKNTGTFYIVIAGMVNVIKGGKTVVRLAEGAYFGEISMLTGKPHRATVQAHSHVVLLAVTKEGFDHFFRGSEQLLAEFQMRMLGFSEINLDLCLKHTLARTLFRNHLENEHSEEHLNFWEEANAWHVGKEGPGSYSDICANYIGGDSKTPINVIDRMWQSVKDKGEVEGVFDECIEECYNLMKRDNYSRFKTGPLFKELMDAICCYTQQDLEINEEEVRRADMSFGKIKFSASTGEEVEAKAAE